MEKKNFILLMLGLLGELHIQIIGSIAISELIMFVIAPVIFINDFGKLRRHGFMPYFFSNKTMSSKASIESSPRPLPNKGASVSNSSTLISPRFNTSIICNFSWFIKLSIFYPFYRDIKIIIHTYRTDA